MLMATGIQSDGTPVVMLGLSAENLALMQQDQPVRVLLDDLEPRLPHIAVVIWTGPTDEFMREALLAKVSGVWELPDGQVPL